jgi:anti-anti-sigma factor
MSGNLEVEKNQVGDVTVFHCTGKIACGATVQKFGEEVTKKVKELANSQDAKIVVGLNGISFIDSSCVGELTAIFRAFENPQRQLRFAFGEGQKIHRFIKPTRLLERFYVSRDEKEAIASLSLQAA